MSVYSENIKKYIDEKIDDALANGEQSNRQKILLGETGVGKSTRFNYLFDVMRRIRFQKKYEKSMGEVDMFPSWMSSPKPHPLEYTQSASNILVPLRPLFARTITNLQLKSRTLITYCLIDNPASVNAVRSGLFDLTLPKLRMRMTKNGNFNKRTSLTSLMDIRAIWKQQDEKEIIAILQKLCEPIETKLDNGDYVKRGGLKAFKNDIAQLNDKLEEIAGPLTEMMRRKINEYIQSLKIEEDAIAEADRMITKSHLNLAAVRQKALEMKIQDEIEEKEMQLKEKITEEHRRVQMAEIKQLKIALKKEKMANQQHFEDLLKQQFGSESFYDGKREIVNSRIQEIQCLNPKNGFDATYMTLFT